MMQARKKGLLFAATALLVLVLVILFLGRTTEEQNSIRRLKTEIGIIPETPPIFTKDTHGAFGEGISLDVYPLSQNEAAALREGGMKNWSHLPMEQSLKERLLDKTQGLMDETSLSYWETGLAAVPGVFSLRPDGVRTGADSDLYENMTVCILDLADERLYLASWDR